MLNDYECRMAAEILRVMQAQKIDPIEKVFLHKFIYFLGTQEVPTGFRFRPYTYGPYSFDLANTLEKMAFWDAIEECRYSINLKNLETCAPLGSEIKNRIEAALIKFQQILGQNYSFDSLERVGTVLYCMQAIAQSGEEVNEKEVVSEFKGWKGRKYPEASIKETFSRIQGVLST